MKISKSTYGTTAQGASVSRYRIENESKASVTVSDYGCRLMQITVPDRRGQMTNVCLELSDLNEYLNDDASLGVVAGRCANRIANGRFTLNGKTYTLSRNNGPNHLHGGPTGFGRRIWDGKISGDTVVFSRLSPDGEEGYPGNLNVSVTYGWSDCNELSILYEASCDADTVFSVTSHGYFNLDGAGSPTVLNHELSIDSDFFTEIDNTQIPTGRILPVADTPLDFRSFKTIGADINAENSQLAITGTYDHNLVLNGDGFRRAAILQSKNSGIRMTCLTDQPALQLYVPNQSIHRTGKDRCAYPAFSSVCLETQHYPDSVHHPDFPSVILKAGETYQTRTIYRFSIM